MNRSEIAEKMVEVYLVGVVQHHDANLGMLAAISELERICDGEDISQEIIATLVYATIGRVGPQAMWSMLTEVRKHYFLVKRDD